VKNFAQPEIVDADGRAPEHKGPRTPFVPVKEIWIFSPLLGAEEAAISIFVQRPAPNVSFSPTENLRFRAAYTPLQTRISALYLVDVDFYTNGNGGYVEITWRGKSHVGTTEAMIRARLSTNGRVLRSYGFFAPDSSYAMQFDLSQPPEDRRTPFDASTAIVCNKKFLNLSGSDIVVQFSKLDKSVQMPLRLQRAQQAWEIMQRDLKYRSSATLDKINGALLDVYHEHFSGKPFDPSFWRVDVEQPPRLAN
jgi:hypothetical protein